MSLQLTILKAIYPVKVFIVYLRGSASKNKYYLKLGMNNVKQNYPIGTL